MLFYWYDPQYLNAQYDLVQVQLPKRFKGCLDDEKEAGKARVRVPAVRPRQAHQRQVRDERLARACAFVKKWKWTAADQNFVANLIAGKKMKPEKAAEQWVKANAAKVNAWLK